MQTGRLGCKTAIQKDDRSHTTKFKLTAANAVQYAHAHTLLNHQCQCHESYPFRGIYGEERTDALGVLITARKPFLYIILNDASDCGCHGPGSRK